MANEATLATQRETPVALDRLDARVYWMFQNCVYWEDEDLSADDVKALVLQRSRRCQRQLATAQLRCAARPRADLSERQSPPEAPAPHQRPEAELRTAASSGPT